MGSIRELRAGAVRISGPNFWFLIRATDKGPKLVREIQQNTEPELVKRIKLTELDTILDIEVSPLKDDCAFQLNAEALARLGTLSVYVREGAWHLAALHMIECGCTRCPRLQRIFQEIFPLETREVFWASSLLNSRDIRENGDVLDCLCFGAPQKEKRLKTAGKIIRGAKRFYTSIYKSSLLWRQAAGSSQSCRQDTLQPGQEIFLAPDMYKNPGKVVAFTSQGKLGELPGALTRELAPMLERGIRYTGRIARIMGSWRNEEDRLTLEISKTA
ncbi:MAG: hypothetical protein ACLFSY_02235 [Desulfonatronovibrionaceae bacterium]